MNPLLTIAIPLGLVILGMILNSFDLGFDQLPSSPEQDPVKRLTVSDGNNVKYLIKLPQADKLEAAAKDAAKEKVSSWELEKLGTALSIGDNSLPLGVALKISQ